MVRLAARKAPDAGESGLKVPAAGCGRDTSSFLALGGGVSPRKVGDRVAAGVKPRCELLSCRVGEEPHRPASAVLWTGRSMDNVGLNGFDNASRPGLEPTDAGEFQDMIR